MILDGEFFSVKSKEYNEKTLNCVIETVKKLDEIDDKPLMMLGKMYFILNLCAKFSLKSQPSIYGKYGKRIL